MSDHQSRKIRISELEKKRKSNDDEVRDLFNLLDLEEAASSYSETDRSDPDFDALEIEAEESDEEQFQFNPIPTTPTSWTDTVSAIASTSTTSVTIAEKQNFQGGQNDPAAATETEEENLQAYKSNAGMLEKILYYSRIVICSHYNN